MEHFIGLMSGTSLDGVDGVLASFAEPATAPLALRVQAHHHVPFEPALRGELLALNSPGANELHRAALAGNALMRVYAQVVTQLLAAGRFSPDAVRAIGAHGQTVRHRPQEFDGIGYTWQLMNGAMLAELTGMAVVCDFRNRDLAAGGQGAPLVPAFHAAMLGSADHAVAVLNLGGFANLTLLPAAGEVLGFDCGPANALLDGWCMQQRGCAYDEDGLWSASGRIDASLLQMLLAEPFFERAPPKSTGRDLFNMAWLHEALQRIGRPIAAPDVQATLVELTTITVARSLRSFAPQTAELLVCGGGAFNAHLMSRLAAALPGVGVTTTATRGIAPDRVEALAFAWLAHCHLQRHPANLPSATGAAGPRILGTLYPA